MLFQRIARRDEKAFLSDQCKEIEENNTMGMIRDLFKKIRDTKGNFHAKMGTIEDSNTWTAPDGQYRNEIDYILCRQRRKSSIQSAKTRQG